jgi:hypothetical protein
LTDADLRAAARADFARRTEGLTYVSPLPPTQAHPVGLPAGMTTDGAAEMVSDIAANA